MRRTAHDGSDQRRTIRFTQHDAGNATTQSHQRIRGSADVELRHRDEVDRAFLEAETIEACACVCHQVGLTEHHALGTAGGAGTVHHQRGVLGAHLVATARRFVLLEPRLVRVLIAALRRHLHDGAHTGQRVADALDRRHQLGADHQQTGARVVDRVVQLLPRRSPVEDRQCRAQSRAGEHHLGARRVILVEEADNIAAADAGGGQGGGDPPDAVIELRPGPGARKVGHGRGVWSVGGPERDVVVEEDRGRGRCGAGRGHGSLLPSRMMARA